MIVDPKHIGTFSIIAILVICCLPWLFTTFSWLDFSETGQIGDTIGGIMTPFIAIIAATLTFVAFWVQYKANEQQKEAFENQKKNAELERFENRFYELLRIHKQNVSEMKIGLLENYNVFKEMYYELCNCKVFVNKVFDELTGKAGDDSFANPNDEEKKKLADFYTKFDCEKRNNLAYQLFFQGIEFNHLFKVISSDNYILESERDSIQKNLKDFFLKQYDNWQQGHFSMTENNKPGEDKLISYYRPYCGRSEWLGHYFRHLYQTVKFIDKACLCKNQKYEYIKTLKAQLSEYEQAILFYHACSDLGKEWFEEGKGSFIVKYRLIQHLPLLMVYNDECKDLSNKLFQFLSDKDFEDYFKKD